MAKKPANGKAKKAKIALKPYKTYHFTGQDPIVRKVQDEVTTSGNALAAVSRDSGVASSTMGNWFKRKTKRPQFATVNAVLMALDKELVIAAKK